jgi:hypothetical protein
MFENFVRSYKLSLLLVSMLYFIVVFFCHYYHGNSSLHKVQGSQCEQLLNIIALQNDTVEILESVIKRNISSIHTSPVNNFELFKTLPTDQHGSSSNKLFLPSDGQPNDIESTCETRYGFNLPTNWRNAEELWCSSPSSSLKCYPFRQPHKEESNVYDNFCVAENFIVDFSKVLIFLIICYDIMSQKKII